METWRTKIKQLRIYKIRTREKDSYIAVGDVFRNQRKVMLPQEQPEKQENMTGRAEQGPTV